MSKKGVYDEDDYYDYDDADEDYYGEYEDYDPGESSVTGKQAAKVLAAVRNTQCCKRKTVSSDAVGTDKQSCQQKHCHS